MDFNYYLRKELLKRMRRMGRRGGRWEEKSLVQGDVWILVAITRKKVLRER